MTCRETFLLGSSLVICSGSRGKARPKHTHKEVCELFPVLSHFPALPLFSQQRQNLVSELERNVGLGKGQPVSLAFRKFTGSLAGPWAFAWQLLSEATSFLPQVYW